MMFLGLLGVLVINALNDPFTSSDILSYNANTESFVHCIAPSFISFCKVLKAEKMKILSAKKGRKFENRSKYIILLKATYFF